MLDHEPAEFRVAVFTADAPAEAIEKTVEVTIKLLDKFEARWADGRAHVAGVDLTAADFSFLTAYTSLIANQNLRN